MSDSEAQDPARFKRAAWLLAAAALAVAAMAGAYLIRTGGARRIERAAAESAALHERGLSRLEALGYDRARDDLERALELRRSVSGTDHPATWQILRSLARLERELNDYPAEAALLRELAESLERVLGSEHPDLAEALNALGTAQGNAGELAAAEESFQRAGEIFRLTPDPHRSLNLMRTHLSWIAELRGELSLAEAGYRRVLTWWETYLGREHPQTAWTLRHLGYVVAEQGRLAQAEGLLRRALEIYEKVDGPSSAEVGEVLYALGRVAAAQGHPDRAVALFERSLAVRLEVRPEDHPDVGATREALADARARVMRRPAASGR